MLINLMPKTHYMENLSLNDVILWISFVVLLVCFTLYGFISYYDIKSLLLFHFCLF